MNHVINDAKLNLVDGTIIGALDMNDHVMPD